MVDDVFLRLKASFLGSHVIVVNRQVLVEVAGEVQEQVEHNAAAEEFLFGAPALEECLIDFFFVAAVYSQDLAEFNAVGDFLHAFGAFMMAVGEATHKASDALSRPILLVISGNMLSAHFIFSTAHDQIDHCKDPNPVHGLNDVVSPAIGPKIDVTDLAEWVVSLEA